MMPDDPIVREVRERREEYAAQFDYDLRAIHDDLKAQEKAGGRETVSLPAKRRPRIEQASAPEDHAG